MKLSLSVLYLSAVALLVCSCGQSSLQSEPKELSFDTLHITQYAIPDSAENTARFDINIDLLYASAGDGAEAINDSLLNLCFIDDSCVVEPTLGFKEKFEVKLNNFISSCKEDYKSMFEDVPEPPQFAYYLNVKGRISESSDSTLAYTLTLETYLGGAHGSQLISVMNIDKKTGNMFRLKDIMKDGYEVPLTDVIVRNIASDFKVKDLDGLHEMGIFEMSDPYPAEYCICKADTLTFIYNQYDIAPYSVGIIITSVAKNEIKDWLK